MYLLFSKCMSGKERYKEKWGENEIEKKNIW